MLSDRSYMRDRYEANRTSVLIWLISAIAAAFILQNVFSRWFGAGIGLERLFGLSPEGLRSWHVWSLLTFGFLHSTGYLLEILGNILGLYFIGREILPLLGTQRFLTVYGLALAVGGAFWSALHWKTGGLLLGATPAVTSLFIIFACFFPDRPIQILILFLFPVTFRPRYLAYALAAIDLCGFAFYEVLGWASPYSYAPSAQLGGMAVGWIYYRYFHGEEWSLRGRRDIELPRWLKRREKAAVPAPAYRVNLGARGDIRAEVDRILDKINSHGFGSLSVEEKRVLDEAKHQISRR